jgi:hypothetical protein
MREHSDTLVAVINPNSSKAGDGEEFQNRILEAPSSNFTRVLEVVTDPDPSVTRDRIKQLKYEPGSTTFLARTGDGPIAEMLAATERSVPILAAPTGRGSNLSRSAFHRLHRETPEMIVELGRIVPATVLQAIIEGENGTFTLQNFDYFAAGVYGYFMKGVDSQERRDDERQDGLSGMFASYGYGKKSVQEGHRPFTVSIGGSKEIVLDNVCVVNCPKYTEMGRTAARLTHHRWFWQNIEHSGTSRLDSLSRDFQGFLGAQGLGGELVSSREPVKLEFTSGTMMTFGGEVYPLNPGDIVTLSEAATTAPIVTTRKRP